MKPEERIWVALDYSTSPEAQPILDELDQKVKIWKVGKKLAKGNWAGTISYVHGNTGRGVFADAKIKNTVDEVASEMHEITRAKPDYISVFADGGIEMMKAALKYRRQARVLGVTVLTSMTPYDTLHLYHTDPINAAVRAAQLAVRAGLDAVICSPQDIEAIKTNEETSGLFVVTPGIRPMWAPLNDQVRVLTPRQAINAGADALIIGRPIINPPPQFGTPVEAFDAIVQEVSEAI